MDLDLRKVPFSRHGSYWAVSVLKGEGLWLRALHGGASSREAFLVEALRDGKPVPCRYAAEPSCMRLEPEEGEGTVEMCIPEPAVIRLRGSRLGVRLSKHETGAFDNAFRRGDRVWEVNLYSNGNRAVVTPLAGELGVDAPWVHEKCTRVVMDLMPETPGGVCEAAIEEFRTVWTPRDYPESFEACREGVECEFREWLAKTPSVPEEFEQARELAAYVNWSGVVSPGGNLKRPGMLMSKNWMTRVWSWDHCFNAMALAAGDPDAAFDHLMVMFDCQDDDGALPDSVSDGALVWNFSKPPVHGWAYRKMVALNGSLKERADELYGPLGRWTEWWLRHRDYDGDGVPQYNHGNDSGWDNCTAFDVGPPVEGPDLSAFLVIQMDVLSEMAGWLGKEAEAKSWKEKADGLMERLLAHSWKGDRFVAPRSGDHRVAEGGDSLFVFLPMVLGRRLPEHVRGRLVKALREEGRFLTAHGLATENPQSPKYTADGYWRGPIWAPSTMLIVDGLADAGERELAEEIARRFCRTCATSGFAENFDALTGEGLRDLAYTWTSSVFLLLASEYLAS